MVEKLKKLTWLRAIEDAAKEQMIELPPFTRQAMGVARSETIPNNRFVTLKRRLIPTSEAIHDGMEWTLWRETDELSIPEIAIRQPLQPQLESVSYVLKILKGWLIDNWTVDETKAAVKEQVTISGKCKNISSAETNGVCEETNKRGDILAPGE